MKERPILFSGSMVRAILEDRKSITRRVIRSQPETAIIIDWVSGRTGIGHTHSYKALWNGKYFDNYEWDKDFKKCILKYCPYGQPGDRLWVRHAWYYEKANSENPQNEHAWDEFTKCVRWPSGEIIENCEPDLKLWKKRPSIHMPRWASRITLEIIAVRVEQLQNITEEDALSEGIKSTAIVIDGPYGKDYTGLYAIEHFGYLWDSINEKRGYGWDKNPWVWVIEFKRIQAVNHE